MHCVAHVDSISSFVLSRFLSLLSTALSSPSPLVQSVFLFHHKWFIHLQVKITSMVPDTFLIILLKILALLVLFVKLDIFFHGYHSPYENLIYYLSCA